MTTTLTFHSSDYKEYYDLQQLRSELTDFIKKYPTETSQKLDEELTQRYNQLVGETPTIDETFKGCEFDYRVETISENGWREEYKGTNTDFFQDDELDYEDFKLLDFIHWDGLLDILSINSTRINWTLTFRKKN